MSAETMKWASAIPSGGAGSWASVGPPLVGSHSPLITGLQAAAGQVAGEDVPAPGFMPGIRGRVVLLLT